MNIDVASQTKTIIADLLGISIDKIQPSAKLVNDLGADSLDMVELVMKLEDQFEICIDDSDAEKNSTVQEIIDYITSKVGF